MSLDSRSPSSTKPDWEQIAKEVSRACSDDKSACSIDPVGTGRTHDSHIDKMRSVIQNALGQRLATKAIRDALPYITGRGPGDGGGLPPTSQLRLVGIIDGRNGPSYEEAAESTNDEATIVRELLLEHLFTGDTQAAMVTLYDHLSSLMEQPRVCTIVAYAFHCARSKVQLNEFHARARDLAKHSKIFLDTDHVAHTEYLELLAKKISDYNEAHTPQLKPSECRAMIYLDIMEKAEAAGATQHESIKELQRIAHEGEYQVETQLIKLCANSHRLLMGAVSATRGGYLHSGNLPLGSADVDPAGRQVEQKVMFGRQRSSHPQAPNGGAIGNNLGRPQQVPLHLRVPEGNAHGRRTQSGNALAAFSRPAGSNGEFKCTPATCAQSRPCKICNKYTVQQVRIATTNTPGREIDVALKCQCEWITVINPNILQYANDADFGEREELEDGNAVFLQTYKKRKYLGQGWPHQQDNLNFQRYFNQIMDEPMQLAEEQYVFEALIDNEINIFTTVKGELDNFDFGKSICPACGECHESRQEALDEMCIYYLEDNDLFAQEGWDDTTNIIWDGATANDKSIHLLHRREHATKIINVMNAVAQMEEQEVGMNHDGSRSRLFWNASRLTESSYLRGGVNSNTLCWHNKIRVEQDRSIVVEKPSQESLTIVRRIEATSRKATANTMFTEGDENELTLEELKIWMWLYNFKGDHTRTLNAIIAESGLTDADPDEFYRRVTEDLLCRVHTTVMRDLEQAHTLLVRKKKRKPSVFSQKLSVNEVYSTNPLSGHNKLIQEQKAGLNVSFDHKPTRFKCFRDTRCDGQHWEERGGQCKFMEPEDDELNDLVARARKKPTPGGETSWWPKICVICHAFGQTTQSGHTPRHFTDKCALRKANGGSLTDDKVTKKVDKWKGNLGNENPNGDGPEFFKRPYIGTPSQSSSKGEGKSYAKNECRAYADKGKCRFGDDCKYEHLEKKANGTVVQKAKKSKLQASLQKLIADSGGSEFNSKANLKQILNQVGQTLGNVKGKRKSANQTSSSSFEEVDSDGESKEDETGLTVLNAAQQRAAKKRAKGKRRGDQNKTKSPAPISETQTTTWESMGQIYDDRLVQKQEVEKALAMAKQLQAQYNASNLSSANADSTRVEDHVSRVSFASRG